jgi:hypothetical protein
VGGKQKGVGSADDWYHVGSHDVGDSMLEELGSGGGVWRRDELDDWLTSSLGHDAGRSTLGVL